MAAPGPARILTGDQIGETNRDQVGGKARALARLKQAGFRVPGFLAVTAAAYREYLDRTVEPDRWILDRQDGRVLEHHGVTREKRMTPASGGIALAELPSELQARPPQNKSLPSVDKPV